MKPHSRPYMASIQMDGQHVCGGCLLLRKWVMTAAHCVIPRYGALPVLSSLPSPSPSPAQPLPGTPTTIQGHGGKSLPSWQGWGAQPPSASPLSLPRAGTNAEPPHLPSRRNPSVRVVLGAHHLQRPEAAQQVFSIVESIPHPHYNSRTVRNDIRLLKVRRPLAPRGPRTPQAAGLFWAGK